MVVVASVTSAGTWVVWLATKKPRPPFPLIPLIISVVPYLSMMAYIVMPTKYQSPVTRWIKRLTAGNGLG